MGMTKAEFEAQKQKNAGNAAKQAEDTQVKYYTDAINAAMGRGETSYQERTGNCSGNVLTRVQAEFSDWTITVSNMRTGCTIRWS